jgi:hypothetical protein
MLREAKQRGEDAAVLFSAKGTTLDDQGGPTALHMDLVRLFDGAVHSRHLTKSDEIFLTHFLGRITNPTKRVNTGIQRSRDRNTVDFYELWII